MRILFVAPYPPSRVRIRSWGFIHHLAARHDITVLALAGDPHDTQDARGLERDVARIVISEEPKWRRLMRSMCAVPGHQPLQVAYAAAPVLRAALASMLRSQAFDVLHVESLRALAVLPDPLPLPTVWDAVDCITRLYDQGAGVGATRIMRLVGRLEARRVREYERRQLGRFHHIVVASARERQAFLTLLGADESRAATVRCPEINVLPHGIDRDYFRPYAEARDADTLIFSGKMGYHANIAGAVSLVEQILPRIWATRPDVRLIIAGKDPPAQVRRLACDPRITVTGYVPDLRPYIGHARVAVSYLPYAVGLQNKVLEAMALGTPVVASAGAAAGLQAVSGRDLLVANDPDAFAAAVLRLLADETLCGELAARGLEYIAAHHDWEGITCELSRLYAHAADIGQPSLPMARVGQRTQFSARRLSVMPTKRSD